MIDLSNDVFGFSLTLLAVSIGVPAIPAALAAGELGAAITALWPRVAVFVLSFIAVSFYWTSHQRIYRYIRRYDTRLLWLNQFFLLFIAFMPIPSAILGLYPLERPAIIFFAGFLALTGLLCFGIWLYATTGRRLVAPDLSSRVVRYMLLRFVVTTAVYVLTIGLSFIAPMLAIATWVLLVALQVFPIPLFNRLLVWTERKLFTGRR